MTSPNDAMERVLAALREVDGAAAVCGADDGLLEFLVAVEEAGRMLDALRLWAAVEVEKRSDRVFGEEGLAARHGYRTGALLVEQLTGVSAANVRQRIRVGRLTLERSSVTGALLPPLFPEVGAALTAGALCLEAADAITRELGKASPRAEVDRLTAAEHHLVAEATGSESGIPLSADLVAGQARIWRDALDPDGIEPRADEAFQARGMWVSRTARHGVHPVGGGLAPEIAAQWFELVGAVATPKSGPRFLSSGPCACPDGECGCEDPDVRDTRTPEQRGHERLGIIARDGTTCLIPGCGVPATGCEAHHVVEWSRDHHTASDNGVLVCYGHHRMLERGQWSIEFIRGKPRVRAPGWLRRRPYARPYANTA